MSLSCQNGVEDLKELELDNIATKRNESITDDRGNKSQLRHRKVDKKLSEAGSREDEGLDNGPKLTSSDGTEHPEVSDNKKYACGHIEEIDDLYLKSKCIKIQRELENNSNEETLKQLAISKHGLVTDKLRKRVWPKLVGVDLEDIPDKPDSNILTSHRDYNQVVMDVNRTLKRFPPGMQDDERLDLQDQLIDVIMRLLVLRPELYYYQGYHDICVTLLLVLGEDLTVAVMDKLSTTHLREFLDNDMDRTKELLSYLYPIIGKSNKKLRKYMEKGEVGTVFCLPWLITWYGHVLNELRHILRLYDFFIACHPLMPVYLAAAIVLYRENDVLECECDMAMIHCLLSKIPEDLPYEKLLEKAGDLHLMYPPKTLKGAAQAWYKQSLVTKPRLADRALATKHRPMRYRKRGMLVGAMGWGLAIALSAAAIAAYRNTSDFQWLSSVASWNWWPS